MFSVTRLVDVDADARASLLRDLRGAAESSGARRWIVEPTDPGSRNGGDLLLHLRFDDESHWRSAAPGLADVLDEPAVTRINGATYRGTPQSTGTPGTVYRALLLRVDPTVERAVVARFESELLTMPRYVHTIRAWQLSPVQEAIGTSAWTHVFEQEFTDTAGLMGPYLMHPIHWAVVDRWFDPESTDVIVRDRVAHSFCAMDHPVLHGATPTSSDMNGES